MEKFSVDAIVREQAGKAASGRAGRAAATVYGGHEKALRQTVIALTAGTSLAEHESPGDATVYVLDGRVRLASAAASWEGRQGDLLVVPPARHSLEALTRRGVLLTVAKHA